MKKQNNFAKFGAVALAAVAVVFASGGQASAANKRFQKGFNDPFYGVKSLWRSVKSWF